MLLFIADEDYAKHEALLFKMVFTTYSSAKMAEHGFREANLDRKWSLVDSIRKRSKRNKKTKKEFLKLEAVKAVYSGFFESEAMTNFTRNGLRSQRHAYIKHFEKFASRDILNLE